MNEHRHLSTHAEAERFARETRSQALRRGDAVVVGNRAGVVEWVSPAWHSLTGFPLEDTFGKPITHFLEVADFEAELVQFVAQNFLAGRRCAVEFPFSALDGRDIHVHLDVEPIRDTGGEIARFVAVGREIPPPVDDSKRAPQASTRPSSPPIPESVAGTRDWIDLASLNELVRTAYADPLPPEIALDLVLSNEAYEIECGIGDADRFVGNIVRNAAGNAAREKIARLLRLLFEAATAPAPPPHPTPRFVSIVTGLIEVGRSHHSLVHAIPARAVANRQHPGLFIEVHDTAPHLSRDALNSVRSGHSETDRERAWAAILRLGTNLGATVYFDSTPGCGNQALVIFDLAR